MTRRTKKTEKKHDTHSARASATRQADPFHAREAQQYENPLPSREYVLQVLTERGVPMPFSELAGALDISPHELDFFDRRLRAMERDGQVVRNRRDAYLLPAKADLIKGRVEGHPDGFGFLRRDDGQPDIFLGPKEYQRLKAIEGQRSFVMFYGWFTPISKLLTNIMNCSPCPCAKFAGIEVEDMPEEWQ